MEFYGIKEIALLGPKIRIYFLQKSNKSVCKHFKKYSHYLLPVVRVDCGRISLTASIIFIRQITSEWSKSCQYFQYLTVLSRLYRNFISHSTFYPEFKLVSLTVFKEAWKLVSNHFGKLGIKYIPENIMIFLTLYLLFPFLNWHQLAQIYMYIKLSFNCKVLIYANKNN